MGTIGEFKKFAMRGNVLDLAVGIILGLAFGNIVNSLVNDIIMPPLGMVIGKVDFTDLFISLNGVAYESLAAAKAAGAPTINYGVFINTIINFIIVALAIFLLINQVNRFMPPPPQPASETKDCPYCKESISKEATRCPHCTSDLAETGKAEVSGAQA
jgi:large conductance mechanosensitive channel